MATEAKSVALAVAPGTDGGEAIEALVMKGDISALEPRARASYYITLCTSLDLNPATQPIKFIAFQGKTVPYFTRDATDQLAAKHRLNREIVDGPKVVDFAGHKLLYAFCRATHPNGRVETATAYLPIPHGGGEGLANAAMKTETKSRRRATLAILGLGFIDESELDTMPGARQLSHAEVMGIAKAPAGPIGATVEQCEPPQSERPAVTALHDDLDALGRTGTVWQTAALWLRHRDAIAALGSTDAQHDAQGACIDSVYANGEPRAVSSAEWRDVLHVLEACPSHEALRVLVSDLTSRECTSLADVAAIWTLHKADVAKLTEDTRKLAWTAAVRRAGEYVTPPTKPADALRKALAPKPTPPTGTDGERGTPAGDDGAADDFERHQAQNDGSARASTQAKLLAAMQRLKGCESSVHVVRHYAVHVDELPQSVREAYREHAIGYLHGRYPRACPSRAVAAEMLDRACFATTEAA